MATVTQTIDYETAALASDHFNVDAVSEEAALEAGSQRHPLLDLSREDPASLVPRPPVVVVMGHVDHGKTSLLDAIRATKVADSEAGGITQRIGAYQVEKNHRLITFIDTPGHEAFTAMRARGAIVTDVAVLVVAADDGVMPQTEEAIQHARSAGVPILVAINKIDKPGANVDKVLAQLAEYELLSDQYGGNTTMVRTSAKSGEGIAELLEMILLVSDIQEPRANPNRLAVGTVIDSHLERGRGPIATLLVQNGTLHVGDNLVVGGTFGKVRALIDDMGKKVKEAVPSMPVVVTGLSDVVEAGAFAQVVATEREARSIAEDFSRLRAERLSYPSRRLTLEELAARAKEGEPKTFTLILKADAQGTIEAVKGQIQKLQNDEVNIKFVAEGVGAITESDVNLAAASQAIIIGFNVRYDDRVKQLADEEGVDVRLYNVVYRVTEDLEKAIKGLREPVFHDVEIGRAEVRKIYVYDGKNSIAGANVQDGKITRQSTIAVLRKEHEIARSSIKQLKRFKDDVREVAKGYDCGVSLDSFDQFEEGDVLVAYVREQEE